MTLVEDFLEAFKTEAPAYYKRIAELEGRKTELFNSVAEPLLGWAKAILGDGYLDRLIDGYLLFVSEVNSAQVKYEQDGKYANTTFADAYEQAYGDPEFMRDYHWGVFVTTFAWEHHLQLYKFFRDEFLTRIEDEKNIVDLGAGSGVYHQLAIRNNPGLKATAVDISPTSVEQSQEAVKILGIDDKVSWVCADAIKWQSESQMDAGICCFLLEHLERPDLLLANLCSTVKPLGYAYITTALTAAEVDHIYEFVRESEVLEMCEKAGFRVVATQSLAPPDLPLGRRFLPRSMGLLLQKRQGGLW